jgi:hypothetical protein
MRPSIKRKCRRRRNHLRDTGLDPRWILIECGRGNALLLLLLDDFLRLLVRQLLGLECSVDGGRSMRAISDGANGRVLRSHIDVWGVTDVARHACGRVCAREIPIGGEKFVSLGQSRVSDRNGIGWMGGSLRKWVKLPAGPGQGYGSMHDLYMRLHAEQKNVTHSRWRDRCADAAY